MGVVNGQAVDAPVTNAAFISKNADDSTISNLGLSSTNPLYGPSITSSQREFNAITSVIGMAINQVYNYTLSWATNLIGASTDTIKVRIEAILNKCLSTATASSILYRDVNSNAQINNLVENFATTVTAAGTTTLTVSSPYNQQFTGTTTQTVVLPGATTLALGQQFAILNRSTGTVTVNANGGSLVSSVAAGTQAIFTVTSIGTSAGVWDVSASASGGGALSVTGSRASPISITAAGGITSSASQRALLFVQGSGGAVTVTANPQISAGTTVGQELYLVGRSDTNILTLSDGTGLSLNGQMDLAADSVLKLFWDGTNYVESGRKI